MTTKSSYELLKKQIEIREKYFADLAVIWEDVQKAKVECVKAETACERCRADFDSFLARTRKKKNQVGRGSGNQSLARTSRRWSATISKNTRAAAFRGLSAPYLNVLSLKNSIEKGAAPSRAFKRRTNF
jgi:hypothetical protein